MDQTERQEDFLGSMRIALRGWQSGLWTATPGIVTKVDLDTMTVEAQPAIKANLLDKEGNTTQVALPLVQDCPIVFAGAGNFVLTMPVAVDDEVLLVFASRCIDGWWQSGGVQAQAEIRMHDLSDGFALVGPRSQAHKIASISSTTTQLRNLSGDTFVEVDNSGNIKLKAPTLVTIDVPTAHFTGNVNVDGNIHSGGTVTGDTDVVAAGKSLEAHVHGGVTTGGGNTGPNT